LRERHAKELAASGKFLLLESIAEEAVIADAVESAWQNVEAKATDEFLCGKGHLFCWFESF
jgi:hypothetical protein